MQIIDKSSGSYHLAKTVGSSSDPEEIAYLRKKAYTIIPTLIGQPLPTHLSVQPVRV